jgi:amidophosphoribosyltransferase
MVSSSPQIRYPDYYGIDMSRLEELCAFRAAVDLIKERGMEQVIAETYRKCKAEPLSANHVRAIYEPFSVDEINEKIVEMLRPEGMQAPIELVYQRIEGLHEACPHHPGDWYFTGHYPTPGGIRMANQAFVNYVEKVIKMQL